MPGARRSVMVTGSCEFPTSGYTSTLTKSEPQEIDPLVLELDLIVLDPTGTVLDVVSHERATYFEYTDMEYKQAHIRPNGPTLDVQIGQRDRLRRPFSRASRASSRGARRLARSVAFSLPSSMSLSTASRPTWE